MPSSPLPRPVRPLLAAAIVLGLGLGGFVDGILLHQILQWHHIASSHPDPGIARDVSLNVMLDGFFHAATWLLVALGIGLLYRAWGRPGVPRSGRILVGGLLAGWGLFNLVEGGVNHQILGLHHVHPTEALAWDVAFLAFGALLVVAGLGLAKSDPAFQSERSAAARRRARGA